MTNKMAEVELAAAFEKYVRTVEGIARRAQGPVHDYCRRKGYKFVAGNGAWYMGKDDEPAVVTLERRGIPQGIASILRREVEGLPGNDLGSLMEDYTP